MSAKRITRTSIGAASAAIVGLALFALGTSPAAADHQRAANNNGKIELPLIPGWYNGKMVAYVQTDASDAGVATSQGANFVPALANVLDAPASSFDDIYVVTNFKQSNIIPSAPIPAGPNNADAAYSPLWRVSTVTWADPTKAHTLKSEAEVTAAQTALLVTIAKTNIVVNCPVISSPQGGTLPNAELESR